MAGIALIIAELVSGTFYLLVLGIASFAGAAASYQQYSFWVQAVLAAATAAAVRAVASAMNEPGGMSAANLKVAELYIQAFGNLAKAGNTLIVPSNLSDVAALISSAMTVLGAARQSEAPKPAPAQA